LELFVFAATFFAPATFEEPAFLVPLFLGVAFFVGFFAAFRGWGLGFRV